MRAYSADVWVSQRVPGESPDAVWALEGLKLQHLLFCRVQAQLQGVRLRLDAFDCFRAAGTVTVDPRDFRTAALIADRRDVSLESGELRRRHCMSRELRPAHDTCRSLPLPAMSGSCSPASRCQLPCCQYHEPGSV